MASEHHILTSYQSHHRKCSTPSQDTLMPQTIYHLNSVLQFTPVRKKGCPSLADSCSQPTPKLRGTHCFFTTLWVSFLFLSRLYLPVFRCWVAQSNQSAGFCLACYHGFLGSPFPTCYWSCHSKVHTGAWLPPHSSLKGFTSYHNLQNKTAPPGSPVASRLGLGIYCSVWGACVKLGEVSDTLVMNARNVWKLWDNKHMAPCLSVFHGFWSQNTGPHGCTAGL